MKAAKDKLLIVVDMQNDFITGSLANPLAQNIVKPMCHYIVNDFKGDIIATLDTHSNRYLETQEGKKLPIKHCIQGTSGCALCPSVFRAILKSARPIQFIKKSTFGLYGWNKDVLKGYKEIILVGTCTDICVVSNALILKALLPETRIKVIAKLCAGTTKENHESALAVMKSCQIEIEGE